jgi:hypothetical protein
MEVIRARERDCRQEVRSAVKLGGTRPTRRVDPQRQAFRPAADEGPHPAEGGRIGARRRLERQPDCRGAGHQHRQEVALYTRVSTDRQTTENQEMELRAIADRAGWNVVRVYQVSGAKGRDERPAFGTLCKDAARRQFDMVMAWSVDRLGRSLQGLINFLSELHVSFMPSGSTSCCTSKGSTPRHRRGRQCFR